VPINRIGFAIAYGELAGLLAVAGRAVAAELLLEGRMWTAEEAFAKGLLTRVVPDENAQAEAYASARRIADGAPLVARWHKKFIRRLLDPRPLTQEERDEGYACFDTEDFKTGVAAFLAKQKPQFKGR
jgi:enoyl-CoA hydratase/carnithine racemase